MPRKVLRSEIVISTLSTGAGHAVAANGGGNVMLTANQALQLGGTVNATQADLAAGTEIDGSSLVTAGTANLDAVTGIGNTNATALSASTIG